MSIFTALKYGRPDLDSRGDLVAIPFPILNEWFLGYIEVLGVCNSERFTTSEQIAETYLNSWIKHNSIARKEEITNYLVKIIREWHE